MMFQLIVGPNPIQQYFQVQIQLRRPAGRLCGSFGRPQLAEDESLPANERRVLQRGSVWYVV